MVDRHNSIGVDLVAMCVNDVICCGAEPLFFLDYVAMSHDDPVRLEQIVEGISNGCIQAGCALLGGETAIMPDLYREGDYDLAGFLCWRCRKTPFNRRLLYCSRRRRVGHFFERDSLQRL